jgi:septum formation protein
MNAVDPPPIAPLILASASRYRAELLSRLQIPFEAIAADVDETPLPGELPRALAERLAVAKAQVLADRQPDRWVLGSDQVCACEGRPLGKPGTREIAIAQLTAQSGRSVEFFTAVVLMRSDDHVLHTCTDITTVHFRALTAAEIERYVDAENALDCAGSFKCEGLGISLFDAIESNDPTGLIGLPLIAVSRMLKRAGLVRP